MKRFNIILASHLVLFMFISIASFGQRNRKHHNDRSCNKTREYKRHDRSNCYQTNKDISHRHKGKRRVVNSAHQSNCNQHYHVHRYHHKHHVHRQQSAVHYFRHLPSRHYVRLSYANETYYYCNGLFYAFQPHYGYHVVSINMRTIERRPSHCYATRLNGREYYYTDGFYYIPDGRGRYYVCQSAPCN